MSTQKIPGDVNGDGVVDINDAFANIPDPCPECGAECKSEADGGGCTKCSWPNKAEPVYADLGVTDALLEGEAEFSAKPAEDDEPHLVFKGASQSFDGDGKTITVVKDITFEAKGNETIAILGPSGCGKSTVLKMVSGMHPRGVTMPTVGECQIDGEVVDRPHDDVLTVFQTPVLAGWKTVLGNVMLAFRPFLFGPRARFPWEWAQDVVASMADMVPPLRGKIPNSKPWREIRERSEKILRAVGLGDSMHKFPHQLSGGMRQRAALATTLVVNPRIMCMDEPFSALDPTTRIEMRNLVKKLKSEYPCLTLFVTHDVDEALDLADRIIVLSTRPATVLEDIHVPEGIKPGSTEWATLEARILHLIRDAASSSGSHGSITVGV
jgi:NitT/TauT family transport system ATP-binding protein